MKSKLHALKQHLTPGSVYRRADLLKWSNAIDRHLAALVASNHLVKLSQGLYLCPKQGSFGSVPAGDKPLVKAFLKDDHFLLTSANAYNALGVGTTQLYRYTTVYNHKRHGLFKLGGRTFDFRFKPRFPAKLTEEFLLVDLINNLSLLAEDPALLKAQVKKKAFNLKVKSLKIAVKRYANEKSKKFFDEILLESKLNYAQ